MSLLLKGGKQETSKDWVLGIVPLLFFLIMLC